MNVEHKIQINKTDTIAIYYNESVDCDGLDVRQEFYELINKTKRKSKYQRAHEWCCGHGAIGYKILQEDLCHHLVLTDKFKLATDCCQLTALNNNLLCVSIYNCDSLGHLPKSEKWDLFVANPPWRFMSMPGERSGSDDLRKMVDKDWAVHKNMWTYLPEYLTEDADIYLYEDTRYSNEHTWKKYIENAGLKLLSVYRNFGIGPRTGYIMHIIKKD
jgi:methylase of polypeptide subunit release factors